MKAKLLLIVIISLFMSCTSQKNSEAFIKAASGRYLFNANEVLEIYFMDAVMHAKWRGNNDLNLLKVNDSTFYMKAINEKMLFVSKPKMYIKLAPKTEHDGVLYHFKKMDETEKTPGEYFNAKQFNKALIGFKAIQEKDSLSPVINERKLNSLGYQYIRDKEYEFAVEIFKINTVLYPQKSNVYHSLGSAYLYQKDTTNAVQNFKKALSINPENNNAKRTLEKIRKNK